MLRPIAGTLHGYRGARAAPRGLEMVFCGSEMVFVVLCGLNLVFAHRERLIIFYLSVIVYRAPRGVACCAHTPHCHTISPQTALARFPCPKTSPDNSPRIQSWHKGFSLCATPRAGATLSSPRRGRSQHHCLELVSVHPAALAGYRVAKEAAPASACAGFSHRPSPYRFL